MDKKYDNGCTLVPICSSCKKIRSNKGDWERIEIYIERNSRTRFTHGICPQCEKQLYPMIEKNQNNMASLPPPGCNFGGESKKILPATMEEHSMDQHDNQLSTTLPIAPQVGGLNINHEVQILLVQHNVQEAKRTMAAIWGFNLMNNVHWVRNGKEALNFLLGRGLYADRSFNHQPKLVMLDYNLPDINGLNVLRYLRSLEKEKDMPVVLLVSSKQEIEKLECARPGDCACMIKPMNLSKLKEIIWGTQYFILPTFWEAKEQHVLYKMA